MKVLLLSLPGLNEDDGYLFPLGIGYLAASINQVHEVEAYHYTTIGEAKAGVLKEISRFQPHMVGLTCSTFNRGFVREIIKIIRNNDQRITIVVGGVHASFCFDQMLSEYDADVVVIGEGEQTFPELCAALENKTELKAVSGIAYKDYGKVILNQQREPISDLDALPLPDYSYAESLMRKSRMGLIITSRGCPVRCTFCSTSSYWGQKVRKHSVNRVVDEMERLVSAYNVKKIFFLDDTFNLGIQRVKDICTEIQNRKISVEWGCGCRVSPVSEDMIAHMVEAGCRHICWGIESGSKKIQDGLGKKISLDQVRFAYALSKKFSHIMSTGAFTMVGNPGETAETIQETIDFLNTIPLTDAPSTSILYILPGTVLYEDLKKHGKISDSDWHKYNTVPYFTLENSFHTLSKWANQVNGSGNRLPFNISRHFWDVQQRSVSLKSTIRARVISILHKPKKIISFIKGLMPAGKIRF